MYLFRNHIHPSIAIKREENGEIDAMRFWHIMLGFWDCGPPNRLYIKSSTPSICMLMLRSFYLSLSLIESTRTTQKLLIDLLIWPIFSIFFIVVKALPNSSYLKKTKNPPTIFSYFGHLSNFFFSFLLGFHSSESLPLSIRSLFPLLNQPSRVPSAISIALSFFLFLLSYRFQVWSATLKKILKTFLVVLIEISCLLHMPFIFAVWSILFLLITKFIFYIFNM